MMTNLRKLRRDRGWSLERLAMETDMSVSQLSRIERGESAPSADSMAAICNALGCSAADIYLTAEDYENMRLARKFRNLPPAERNIIERIIDPNRQRRPSND